MVNIYSINQSVLYKTHPSTREHCTALKLYFNPHVKINVVNTIKAEMTKVSQCLLVGNMFCSLSTTFQFRKYVGIKNNTFLIFIPLWEAKSAFWHQRTCYFSCELSCCRLKNLKLLQNSSNSTQYKDNNSVKGTLLLSIFTGWQIVTCVDTWLKRFVDWQGEFRDLVVTVTITSSAQM